MCTTYEMVKVHGVGSITGDTREMIGLVFIQDIIIQANTLPWSRSNCSSHPFQVEGGFGAKSRVIIGIVNKLPKCEASCEHSVSILNLTRCNVGELYRHEKISRFGEQGIGIHSVARAPHQQS